MTACFADTFFFLALLIEGDDAHSAALEFAQEVDRSIITSEWVLMELGDALATTRYRGQLRPFLEFLASQPLVEIVPAEHALFLRAVELFDQRPDKAWSLTDCTSFLLMQDRGLTDALTGDHHFEQAGFRCLLKSAP